MNFVNGEEEAQVSGDRMLVEFSPVGPVTSTECQLDSGAFVPCERLPYIS